MTKRIRLSEKTKIVLRQIFCVLVFGICVFGLYVFIERCFWEELFYLVDYAKEYDYTKNPDVYFLESAAMSVLFAAAAHCAKHLYFSLKRYIIKAKMKRGED